MKHRVNRVSADASEVLKSVTFEIDEDLRDMRIAAKLEGLSFDEEVVIRMLYEGYSLSDISEARGMCEVWH